MSVLWRVFPWDTAASEGVPFSRSYVPPHQFSGRFDLQDQPLVLYLAESEAHAVGEKLQRYRGRQIAERHLTEYGHPLALTRVATSPIVQERILDLTDPTVLERLDLRPDALASHDRSKTQTLARRLYATGAPGFRWWSMLTGDWHGYVMFLDRLKPEDLIYDDPIKLTLDLGAVADAATLLGIGIVRD